MRERVDAAAHELFRIGKVVLVRRGAQAVGVGFLDDGAVKLGRELRVLAHAVVDPHFDDVDAERGLLAHAGAPSSAVVIQYGTSLRPGSGAVKPRPAVR